MWTVSEVKDKLPDVRVVGNTGKEYKASVRGRRERFAYVSVDTPEWGPVATEFTWEAVAASLNSGYPLKWR